MLVWGMAVMVMATPADAEGFGMRLGAWEFTTALGRSPSAQVEKACITKPDLLNLVHGPDTIEDDPCRLNGRVRSSKRRWAVNMRCQDGSQLHAEFTADAPERVSGTMLRLGGQHALTQRLDYRGRWLGGSCAGIR